jgi:hypothetical protein
MTHRPSRRLDVVVATIGALALFSCSEPEDAAGNDESSSDDGAEAMEDFPTAPPVPAGAREYEFPEQIIQPGAEVQNCIFLDPETDDIYATALESYQGVYGHHFVVFYTAAPEVPGTVRDCSTVADMLTLIPAISSVNFGLEKFPEGMAVRIPAGTQLVLQQHYVNTSDKPLRVKDVMHLHIKSREEVETLAGFWGVSDITFSLPPDGEEQVVEFDCVAPRDMKVLMSGPHMHEWGLRFQTSVIRDGGEPEVVVDVDPWLAEYRDNPPVKEFGEVEPLELKQGDIVRTKCVFKNTTDAPLEFPSEMCASYGYYFPAPEGSETWTCAPDHAMD